VRLYRLRVCQEVSKRLSHLKARTGLTPNILCRIGFCLSLDDPSIPNPADYPPDSDREIDRHTLTGQWDRFFVALIKVRCEHDELPTDDDAVGLHFRAHVNRGVLLLYKRIRTVQDLALILPREHCGETMLHSNTEAEDIVDDEPADLS
jgi:DNA sulfur modification protein DndE